MLPQQQRLQREEKLGVGLLFLVIWQEKAVYVLRLLR